MEQFQGPGACLVVERIIRDDTDDASQEKGQSCLFVLERYRERSTLGATIRIGREMLCLPYAGFFFRFLCDSLYFHWVCKRG